jgi:hypothetical protein
VFPELRFCAILQLHAGKAVASTARHKKAACTQESKTSGKNFFLFSAQNRILFAREFSTAIKLFLGRNVQMITAKQFERFSVNFFADFR